MGGALRTLPALALMALIWALSATPDLGTGLGTIDLVLRKAAHVTIFGALTVAWALAFRPPRPRLAAVIALVWAVVDEVHQTFVSGRVGSPLDVGFDAVGIALAVVLVGRLARRGRAART